MFIVDSEVEMYLYFCKYDFMVELYSSEALLYDKAFPIEMLHIHIYSPQVESLQQTKV